MLSFESMHKFWVSRNFPETVWWTITYRQATHPLFACFLGSWDEPPSRECYAASCNTQYFIL